MRGKINSIILNTLKDGNKYGLEIIKSIKNLTFNQLDVKLPSLYSSLHKLESEGFITSYWENSEIGGKRRYSALTEKGLKYVEEHPYNFEEFKKYENVSKNVSSTLAIQPDFFNTIEHSKRTDTSSPTPTEEIQDETISNYSILDYLNQTSANTNLNNVNEKSFENKNSTENEEVNDFRVYDKTDAVLLSDKQIIPQDASTSLLYKPTTLSYNDLKEDAIDFDSIFGEMIEKDNTSNELKKDNNEVIKTGLENTDQGILLNPNEKSKYMNEYQSMVSNKSTLKIDNNNDLLPFSKQDLTNQYNENLFGEPSIESNGTVKKSKFDSYLIKDKVKVDDKLKANIFLKRSNNIVNNYNLYNSSQSTKKQFIEPIITKSEINYKDNVKEDKIENDLPTLTDFIDNCELNGIKVQRYRKNNTKLKSHKVYINKTNLLTSILSYATLVVLMFICYFAFKESLTELQSISYLIIGILGCSIVYPIVYAIIAVKKEFSLIGYYNINKEWLPRLIIFAVIVLLTFAVNFLCGLNLSNFIDYLPYIIIPIVASLVVFIDYLYKSLFLQLKVFREK